MSDPDQTASERISAVSELAARVGLDSDTASDLCRQAAAAFGSDACLLTLTSITKQHLIGSHGLRTRIANFDRCFGDDCLETSFFEVADLLANPGSAHSPLVDGTADTFRSLIATPLFHEGQEVGEMLFFFRTPRGPFTDRDRRAVLAEKRKAQAFLTSAAQKSAP